MAIDNETPGGFEADEFAYFFDVALELMCVADLDGHFLRLNPAWETTLGFSRAELMAKPFLEFVHPDDVAPTIKSVERLANRENVTDFVNRYRCKDGSYRSFEWRSVSDGVRIYAAARDITEHLRAEEAMRRMAAAVEHSEDAIYFKDRDLLLTDWNHGAERIYGYTAAEVIGRHISIIVPEEKRDELQRITEQCLRGERAERIETLRKRKDGTVFDVSLSVSPIMDAAGRVIGSAAIARDITERKKAVAALRYERDRAQSYLDVAEVMLVALDRQGNVTLLNRKGAQVTGYAERELLGRNWFDTCRPPSQRALAKTFFERLCVGNAGDVYATEGGLLTRYGQERLISWHGAVLRDPNGRVTGVLSCGEDVTEEREAGAERERLIRQLQAALAEVKMLSGLLPICAHCKKVRDDQGYWHGVEMYISSHSQATFSHGVCPDCVKKFYPDLKPADKDTSKHDEASPP